jgi:hypothetical protein
MKSLIPSDNWSKERSKLGNMFLYAPDTTELDQGQDIFQVSLLQFLYLPDSSNFGANLMRLPDK